MNNKPISIIVRNAVVAALYFALTLISTPISFNAIQFRISEILVLLCFFNRDYIIGVTLGCALSNLLSPMLPWDLIFGTLATLISALLVAFIPYLGIGAILTVLINGVVVGLELHFILDVPLLLNAGLVMAGELTVLVLGYIFFMTIGKKEFFQRVIFANKHLVYKW